MSQITRWFALAAACLAMAVLAALVNPLARAQAPQGEPPAPARTLPIATGASAEVPDMGSTYRFLERKATKVTTIFEDGRAVAERHLDGSIRASLQDRAGNERSQLGVDHDGSDTARVSFTAGGRAIVARPRPALHPTLDWANLQAHALSSDEPRTADDLEWQGAYLRLRGSRRANGAAPVAVRTEFESGLEVVTASNAGDIEVGHGVRRRPTFVSRVLLHGAEVGAIRWYAAEQILGWDFPGLSRGFVDPSRLKDHGGWTFTPTLAWANIQGLAFYEFHSRVKAGGSVAQSRPSLPRRLLEAVAPTLAADSAGCDGLHWFDDTVLRPCCDVHDRCYQRNSGCSASSWYWVPWTGNSWTCSLCNTQVTLCFLTGGTFNLDYQTYW